MPPFCSHPKCTLLISPRVSTTAARLTPTAGPFHYLPLAGLKSLIRSPPVRCLRLLFPDFERSSHRPKASIGNLVSGEFTCAHSAHQSRRCLHAKHGWSQENLFVPGTEEVFVTPGGVLHYIEDHSYLPPASFLLAVSRCPDVDSIGYRQALRQANAGVHPPA